MNHIDLHVHTYYSDGRFSPAEIIEGAARKGMRVLAITDHDTTRGAREALPLAQEKGIELIPAIEITTRWPGAALPPGDVNVDVLGYFIDLHDREFQAFEMALLNDLHARIAECCRKLSTRRCLLSIDDLFKLNPRYAGIQQLIQAILDQGCVHSRSEALSLALDVWESVRCTPFTIGQAIEQIHLAGGVAVLAHPSIVRPHGQPMTREWLAQLVQIGLDGIEIYHHRLNKQARTDFLKLASEFGLMVTGGSDMHGWKNGLDELGCQPVTDTMLDTLRNHRKD